MDPIVQSTFILLIISLFVCTNGYPNGRVEQACTSMMPQHGPPAQTSAAPYNLTLSKSTYGPGNKITVVLTGNSTFRGFLMQVRSSGSSDSLGSFIVNGNAQTLDCTSKASAVSHTSRDSKSSIQVTWVAPTNLKSDVQIMATVVQTRNIFWTGISSSKLTFDATEPGNSGFQNSASPFFGLILMVIGLWI